MGARPTSLNLKEGYNKVTPLAFFFFLIDAEGINIMMNAAVEAGLSTSFKVGRLDNDLSLTICR